MLGDIAQVTDDHGRPMKTDKKSNVTKDENKPILVDGNQCQTREDKTIPSPPLPVDVDISAVKFEHGPNEVGKIMTIFGSRGLLGPTTTAVVPSAPTGPKRG